jgi:hypothetical protein
LHDYGGFILDNGSDSGSLTSGIGFRTWGEDSAYENSSGDQFAQLASQGWASLSAGGDWSPDYPRWNQGSVHVDGNGNWAPPGVNFAAHMHILDPCVTEGNCP